MKFLIDRCAGRRLADWRRTEGHDVVEARIRSPDPGDEELLRWAVAESRILVTIDKDFGQLIHRRDASHAGLIRLPDVPAAVRVEIMRRMLDRHAAEELSNAIVTVRGNRVRLSK